MRLLQLYPILVGIIGSLAMIQSTVYFNSESSKNFNVIGILVDWVQANFLSVRDGQLLRWAFSTPLTSLRLSFTLLILLVLVLNSNLQNLTWKEYVHYKILPVVIAIFIGLTPETLTLIGFILVQSVFQFKKNLQRRQAIVLYSITTFGVFLSYFSPGSQARDKEIGAKSHQEYFFLMLGNIWQLAWITLTVTIVALIVGVRFRSKKYELLQRFTESLKIDLRVLFFVALSVQIIVETFVYPASYHWISYVVILFLYSFTEIQTLMIRIEFPAMIFTFTRVLYKIFLVFTLFTLVITLNTSKNRYDQWKIRESMIDAMGPGATKSLDLRDNLGNIYAGDLAVDFASIVPYSGYMQNFTTFCFNQMSLIDSQKQR